MNTNFPKNFCVKIENKVELDAVVAHLNKHGMGAYKDWVESVVGGYLFVTQDWSHSGGLQWFKVVTDKSEYIRVNVDVLLRMGTWNKTGMPSKMVFKDINCDADLHNILAYLSHKGIDRYNRYNREWNMYDEVVGRTHTLYVEYNATSWNFWFTVDEPDTYSEVSLDNITFSGDIQVKRPVSVQNRIEKLEKHIVAHERELRAAQESLEELLESN